MKVIELTIDGEVHDVPIKTFDELTIADWQRITEAPEGETPQQLLVRVFGVTEAIADRVPRSKAKEIVDWYASWITSNTDLSERITKVSEAIQRKEEEMQAEEKSMTPAHIRQAMIDAGLHQDHITVREEVFVVPQSLGNTELAQWDVFEETAREHGSKPMATMYAKILACLCLKEGETFEQAPEVSERTAVFMHAKLGEAMVVSAFFFSSDDGFSGIMHRYCPHFLGLRMLWPA